MYHTGIYSEKEWVKPSMSYFEIEQCFKMIRHILFSLFSLPTYPLRYCVGNVRLLTGNIRSFFSYPFFPSFVIRSVWIRDFIKYSEVGLLVSF